MISGGDGNRRREEGKGSEGSEGLAVIFDLDSSITPRNNSGIIEKLVSL